MSAGMSSVVAAEAVGVMGVAALSFASTNFDNLVVLSAYGARPGFKSGLVKLTFLLVCATVLCLSLALATIARDQSVLQIRYLGFIPLAIGLYHLAQIFMGRRDDEAPGVGPGVDPVVASSGGGAYVGFALLLLANSGDSIGVLTPLLSDLKPIFVLAGFVGAFVAALGLALIAALPARHPAARARLEVFARWGLPFLLIAIGAMILYDPPSDLTDEDHAFGDAAIHRSASETPAQDSHSSQDTRLTQAPHPRGTPL
jgi:cadmium resistance protein CadD (predicted permease)